jgi:hypothetical protein
MVPGVAAAQNGIINCPVPNASLGPIAIIQVNDICLDLSGRILQEDKLFVLDTSVTVGNLASIVLDVTMDPDPIVTIGATTTNLVAGPVTYAFLFGTPIVPGFYDSASSTGGVTVTSTDVSSVTVDNSGVYPFYISGYGTVGAVPTNLGVDLGQAPCAAPAGPDTTTCDQGNEANSFVPTFFNNLEALLTYTQDGLGTVASWSGAVALFPAQQEVPEPGTLALLAVSSLGLGVVGLARRRRQQG